LLTGEALFRGDKNSRQLEIIYEKCGSPDDLNWPGVKTYPFYDTLGPKKSFARNIVNFIKNKNKRFF